MRIRMKMRMNKIHLTLLIFLLSLLFSCKERIYEVGKESYNIFVKEENLLNQEFKDINFTDSIEINFITNKAIVSEVKYKYLRKTDKPTEIYFSKMSWQGFYYPIHYKIMIDSIGDGLKAYFVKWVNKVNTKKFRWIKGDVVGANEDKLLSTYPSHFDHYYISENTDSISTNLSKAEIQLLYPEFKGHYQNVQIDTIILYPDYPVYTLDFYENIQFKNYYLGMRIVRRDGKLYKKLDSILIEKANSDLN